MRIHIYRTHVVYRMMNICLFILIPPFNYIYLSIFDEIFNLKIVL